MTAIWNFLISRAPFMEYVKTTQKISFSFLKQCEFSFEWIFRLLSSKYFATMATWVATSYNLYLVLLWSDIGAATDSVRRCTACRSILTLISCTENEEGQSTIPYFCAIIENFSQIVVHLNHYIRHFRALSLSVTFRKHSSQYATELPTIQPLTEQGIQKYSWHHK